MFAGQTSTAMSTIQNHCSDDDANSCAVQRKIQFCNMTTGGWQTISSPDPHGVYLTQQRFSQQGR